MSCVPDISIVIPTWNNLEMLKLCLRSVREHSQLSHQVVVHVNEGTDGTLDWIRQQGIEHTWTPRNVGVCESMNTAAASCQGEYLVYLNDDMYALPGWDRPLFERVRRTGDREISFAAGTMVQTRPISPVAIQADYGIDPQQFQEERLLADFQAGRLTCSDWNGAAWPPSCIHRRWWTRVGGYSTEFSPGFYSDVDFAMKLWQAGCRRFYGIGSSLVYHFGESTTALVRGPRRRNVKMARIQFLNKWGIVPSTFVKYYLQVDQPPLESLPDVALRGALWERARLRLIGMLAGSDRLRPAA